MTEYETIHALHEISTKLMQLANQNTHNTLALDAILEADAILCDYMKKAATPPEFS